MGMRAPALRLLGQTLCAPEIYKIDARGHQEHMGMRRVVRVDGLQRFLQMVDRTKKYRAIEAHDFELRAVR